MEEINKKMIERIKKLLALSESPNESEAESAALKASELLLKHNLHLTDIQEYDGEIKEQIAEAGKRRQRWKTELLVSVAELNFCKVFNLRTPTIKYETFIVGQEHNIIITKEMYEYLKSAISRYTKKSNVRNKKSYKLGMSYQLCKRLEKRKLERIRKKAKNTSCKDLVVLEYENANKQIHNYYKKKHPDMKSEKRSNLNCNNDFFNGYHDANKISLEDQLDNTRSAAIV